MIERERIVRTTLDIRPGRGGDNDAILVDTSVFHAGIVDTGVADVELPWAIGTEPNRDRRYVAATSPPNNPGPHP